MKHKVKEIFDNREEYRRWEDDIQELFNCQLTQEELSILTALIINSLDGVLKAKEFDLFTTLVGIKDKLLEQYEMWVSDDETN